MYESDVWIRWYESDVLYRCMNQMYESYRCMNQMYRTYVWIRCMIRCILQMYRTDVWIRCMNHTELRQKRERKAPPMMWKRCMMCGVCCCCFLLQQWKRCRQVHTCSFCFCKQPRSSCCQTVHLDSSLTCFVVLLHSLPLTEVHWPATHWSPAALPDPNWCRRLRWTPKPWPGPSTWL